MLSVYASLHECAQLLQHFSIHFDQFFFFFFYFSVLVRVHLQCRQFFGNGSVFHALKKQSKLFPYRNTAYHHKSVFELALIYYNDRNELNSIDVCIRSGNDYAKLRLIMEMLWKNRDRSKFIVELAFFLHAFAFFSEILQFMHCHCLCKIVGESDPFDRYLPNSERKPSQKNAQHRSQTEQKQSETAFVWCSIFLNNFSNKKHWRILQKAYKKTIFFSSRK